MALGTQARIYREIFERVQLSPVHFLRLMDAAERRVMLKGNDLIQEGRPHEEVFLIVEGQTEVSVCLWFFVIFEGVAGRSVAGGGEGNQGGGCSGSTHDRYRLADIYISLVFCLVKTAAKRKIGLPHLAVGIPHKRKLGRVGG